MIVSQAPREHAPLSWGFWRGTHVFAEFFECLLQPLQASCEQVAFLLQPLEVGVTRWCSVAWRRGRDGLWPIPDLSGDIMPGVMTVMATAWHRIVSVSLRLKHTHIFVAPSGRAVAADRHASQPPISATGGQLPAGYSKSHAKTRSGFPAGKLPTDTVSQKRTRCPPTHHPWARAVSHDPHGRRATHAGKGFAEQGEQHAVVACASACPPGFSVTAGLRRCTPGRPAGRSTRVAVHAAG